MIPTGAKLLRPGISSRILARPGFLAAGKDSLQAASNFSKNFSAARIPGWQPAIWGADVEGKPMFAVIPGGLP